MPAKAPLANVDDVAAALIEQLGQMDAMKLQKLLYYAQGWHLAITDRRLFAEPVEAWRDGPVVSSVFQQHRGLRRIYAWPSGDPKRLTEEDRQLIDLVCTSYGHLSGDDLSRLTHTEAPWLGAREGLKPEDRSSKRIPDNALKAYFLGRELAGRTSADLAAGGLAVAPLEHDGSLADSLADIRREFLGAPADHPDARFGISGRTRSGVNPRVAARLAARFAQRTAS
jgi:uncharacterized phage-associated protein